MKNENKEEKQLSWQDIKDLANSLTDEQLKNPVRYWKEDEGGRIHDANTLPEDYVSDGEGYSPRSEMDANMIDEDEPVMVKGTPILWIL